MKLHSNEILQDLSKNLLFYLYFISLSFIHLGPPTGPPLWGPYSQGEPVCASVSQLWAPAGQAPLWASASAGWLGFRLLGCSASALGWILV